MKAFELVRLNNGGRMKRAAGPPAGTAEYYSLDSVPNISTYYGCGSSDQDRTVQRCGMEVSTGRGMWDFKILKHRVRSPGKHGRNHDS